MINKYFTIILVLFMAGCENQPDEHTEISVDNNRLVLTMQQIELAGIKTDTLQKQNISEIVTSRGRLIAKAQNRAKVSVPKNGYIEKIYIANGQEVKKGQLLLSLKHPDYIAIQKDYLQTRSKLKLAKQELQRQKTLFENNAGNEKKYEQAQNEYSLFETELKALELNLNLLHIDAEKLSVDAIQSTVNLYAPVSGSANELNVAIGQFVKPEDVLLEIYSNNNFYIELQVFEQNIHKLNIGQVVDFDCNINKCNEKQHTGKIIHIGNYIDKSTKTFKILVEPDVQEPGMRHGMYISAQIFMGNNSRYALPESAVVKEDEDAFVFTAQNDSIFTKQAINIVTLINGFYQIENPQELQNKQIVLSGANYIQDELE